MDHVDIIDAVYQAAVRSELWPDTLCSIVDYVGPSPEILSTRRPMVAAAF